jgi:hypothetical protein
MAGRDCSNVAALAAIAWIDIVVWCKNLNDALFCGGTRQFMPIQPRLI